MRLVPILAAAAVALASAPALADQPGPGWIPAAKVSAQLARRGYHVTKIAADDGHWEGEATKAGQTWEFHVDPRTGGVTKMQRDKD